MYKVIRYFTDLQDNDYPYSEGDIFPRDGLTVSKARYEELASANNKQLVPLIKMVKEEKVGYTKTDINRMSTAELKTFATEQGIENAEDMTGSELKKALIEKLGL